MLEFRVRRTSITNHPGWRQQKQQEILAYMKRPDIVPMPLLCAEACGITRDTARNWLRKGLDQDPEYEYFARQALALRAEYIQKLLRELLDTKSSTPAQKARQFLLTRLSQEDFEPPPIKHMHGHQSAEPPALPEPIEATVELLSLPQSKD